MDEVSFRTSSTPVSLSIQWNEVVTKPLAMRFLEGMYKILDALAGGFPVPLDKEATQPSGKSFGVLMRLWILK